MDEVGWALSACAIQTVLTVCSPSLVWYMSSWTTANHLPSRALAVGLQLTQLHAHHVLQAAHAAHAKVFGGAPAARLTTKMDRQHGQKGVCNSALKIELPTHTY